MVPNQGTIIFQIIVARKNSWPKKKASLAEYWHPINEGTKLWVVQKLSKLILLFFGNTNWIRFQVF